MKKKLFTFMSIGLFTLTIAFEVYSQVIDPPNGDGKALAQNKETGQFCCAELENNSCDQAPDC